MPSTSFSRSYLSRPVFHFSIFTLLFTLHSSLYTVRAQHFSLSRLFYPNITLSATHLPEASAGNGQNFGLTRTGFSGIVPLESEVTVGYSLRKKWDLRARHTVLVANVAQLQPTYSGAVRPDNGYKTASVGAIMLQASVKDRLWVYALGGGVTESNETFFTPQPFMYGGAARMRIIGLNTQILYGTALIYSQKFRILPVFGINKKLNKSWRASALLPFMIDFNYRQNGWLNFDFIGAVGGFSGGFQQLGATEKLLRRTNYQHVKLTVAANAHLFTVLNVSLEAGMAGFRQLRTFNTAYETLSAQTPGFTPYLGATIRYITSKSNFSSKFTRKLGLGGEGINW
jgi:hypothetical protein